MTKFSVLTLLVTCEINLYLEDEFLAKLAVESVALVLSLHELYNEPNH